MLRISRILAGGYLALALFVVVLTTLVGPLPLSNAPFPLQLGPEREPVEVRIAYGTEKREWLEEATRRFHANGPTIRGHPIKITLEGVGSREGVTDIVGGAMQPVVFSPASSIQVELLRYEWKTRNGTEIFPSGANAPTPLVYTPLVLVAWEERSQTLWPNGPAHLWHRLQEVLANDEGWGRFGHPEWGFAKFGHTSPETSNSGIQTLVLLTYAYHEKTSGLARQDILDQEFQQWLDGIENAVMEFGNSTGTFMDNMVNFGPGKYDFVAVYENLPIEKFNTAHDRWNQNLRIYYPPATIFSDHPYAILEAEWVSPEQRDAAAMFRDFLLSEETQQLALQSGFRPASRQVNVGDNIPQNPFMLYEEYGLRAEDIPPQVEIPPGEVLSELIDLWRRRGYD
jgi:hypothetical protein